MFLSGSSSCGTVRPTNGVDSESSPIPSTTETPVEPTPRWASSGTDETGYCSLSLLGFTWSQKPSGEWELTGTVEPPLDLRPLGQ